MAQSHQPTLSESLVSTEVLPDNRVAFRIHAPEARSVSFISDDIQHEVELTNDSRGVWEGFWDDGQPGAYRYHFVVDGVRVYDPAASSAGETTALFMMASGDEFFALKEDVPHGGITTRIYNSETLGQLRRLHVWTPAGFEKSDKPLPVLYLIHGGGDTDNAWPTIGCAGSILDNLLAEGKIEPMLVVMPNGTIESESLLDRLPLFRDDLMTGILPFIESNYEVKTGASNRAIMGLSMGGLETLEVVLSHPDRFGYVGVLSSGWWISDSWDRARDETDDREDRASHLARVAEDLNESVELLIFTQGGPEDLAYDNGMETLKLFDEAGIKYTYSESPGGHTWMTWRKNLWELAPKLFR